MHKCALLSGSRPRCYHSRRGRWQHAPGTCDEIRSISQQVFVLSSALLLGTSKGTVEFNMQRQHSRRAKDFSIRLNENIVIKGRLDHLPCYWA